MHQLLGDKKPAFQAAIDHLQKELSTLRTGRANPALVEDVKVTAYDSTMDLKSMASINVPDAQTLSIEPWDKSLLQTIEKAIRDANLGLSPAVDGSIIRISMPPMTEDNRKKMVKMAKEKLEEAKVSIRSVREGTRDSVTKMEKAKEIGEDEKFRIFEDLEKITKGFQEQVEELGSKKEEEIMKV
jgi:ribosome recycling factor